MKFVQVDDTHWVNIGVGNVAWLQQSGHGDTTLIVWPSGKFLRIHKRPAEVIRLLEEG